MHDSNEQATKVMTNTSVFQWAMMVLILERQIHPSIRLKEQDKYSERMATGEKALVMKQTMSVSTSDNFVSNG